MRSQIVASLLVHGLSLTATLTLAPTDVRGAHWMLLYACITLLTAALFSPHCASVRASLGWGFLIGIPFFCIALLGPGPANADFSKLLLTGTALTLASWCTSELKMICAMGVDRGLGGAHACLLLAALLSTPLWLGPLAQSSQGSELLTNITLATSPATLLAVALDTDYLRNDWLYRHSAFGSLRYQFAPLWQMFVGYSLAGIALTLIRHHRQTTTQPDPTPLATGARLS